MTLMTSAASLTSRVIGPRPCIGALYVLGPTGIRPRLAKKPKTPLKDDGIRIDPPESEPIDTGPRPAATLTADPPLDPPEERSKDGSHGVRHSRATRLSERRFMPNSG